MAITSRPAAQVQQLIDTHGFTFGVLAAKLGVHHRTVRRWVNSGVTPSPLALAQLDQLHRRYCPPAA
jgi:DNA-binding transcriptional regulator YiaG